MALASPPSLATPQLPATACTYTAAAALPAPARPPPAPPQHATSCASCSSQFSEAVPIIPEESGEESGCDSLVEPITPVSAYRYSQDFTLHQQHDDDHFIANLPPTPPKRLPPPVPPPIAPRDCVRPVTSSAPQSRRSSFKRTVANIFRLSNSAEKHRDFALVDSAPTAASTTQLSGGSIGPGGPIPGSDRGFSTKSTSTLSPRSSLEMIPTQSSAALGQPLPSSDDFKKKGRAATGLTLRGRAVNFVVGRGRPTAAVRRASSFDAGNRPHTPAPEREGDGDGKAIPLERLPWPLPPDAGTGVKARRMSLSLPDDFNIDVAELLSEFEYQHKILGRHGKHLGKGAASRVTLMTRKGCPGELYAVKEFRGKSHRESQAEYEKKIKSEFSIGKSLHHPNIIETIRLCTHHSRWNHVMEYCSEGDLFGLVQKGHLKGDDKKKDRHCLFKQLMQGVGYLHANGIAHRDIKLENLLLTKDSKLKITDFGVSEVFSGTHPGLREAGGHCGRNMGTVRLCSPGICGSEPYIAPEVLQKKEQYDARALDVWSSAIVMIYLTFGGAIWSRAERGNEHYDKLVAGWDRWNRQHPGSDASISDNDYPKCLALDVGVNPPALRRLLLQMLNPDPGRRMAAEEVLSNRWMKNVECCQVESYEDLAQMIDASKKDYCSKPGAKKIFCHNHLPPKSSGSHSLGKMPGQAGY